MTIALDNSRIGAHVSGRLINNLRFADDIAVLTESERGLQVLVSRIDEISSKMGMRINLDKTECQPIRNIHICNIYVVIYVYIYANIYTTYMQRIYAAHICSIYDIHFGIYVPYMTYKLNI